jgi:integrase
MWVLMWAHSMKQRGRHPERALSAISVKATRAPGRYADGNGLYLSVAPSGAKRWLLRVVVQGRRRDIGLGSASLVTLLEAREKALKYRRTAREGGDPLAEKRRAECQPPSFAHAAGIVHRQRADGWRNGKHSDQWINTLKHYTFPLIGQLRVDQITTPDILRTLGPIWLSKPETARRVRQRIGVVLDWAKAAGFTTGGNPIDGISQGLPRQPERKNHFSALPYRQVPAFVARLRSSDLIEISKLAFEFLILTAARTSETLCACWKEIDWHEQLWIIPRSRMKAGREHRVPLSDRCLEILSSAKHFSSGSDYIFPGRSLSRPMSNMVFLMTLRRMELSVTAHGFRSAFRDWASEQTNFSREVCEMALAHSIKDKSEAAYRRGDLLERRRELMRAWAAFAVGEDSPRLACPAKRVPDATVSLY